MWRVLGIDLAPRYEGALQAKRRKAVGGTTITIVCRGTLNKDYARLPTKAMMCQEDCTPYSPEMMIKSVFSTEGGLLAAIAGLTKATTRA
jgi:hypothetical protein